MGMDGAYSERYLYEALKQAKGDRNVAVDLILNGQIEPQIEDNALS
jgi:hypothetical protein